ncbi:LTA synthase family protein [Paenibacillus sp. SYP-B3998]|uniref:LTA synthase family protein n=1 Tax=Paenibacillus sp. SYP-B3998 TaxID=2678564 RepID=A0A6G3ZXK5_9BACL|nr:LTA synthase family protein [Paenibacillus sp. SYP-B3998]NEW06778.1 LTA synthase family protein [Paenibacillus sp. SYP-B3998]
MLSLSSQTRQTFRANMRSSLLALISDKWSQYTFYAILVKSLLLLAALHAPDSAGINIRNMYFAVPPVFSHLMFILFVVVIGLFFKSRGRRNYLIGLNTAISLLLFWDLVYYRAYAAFLSLRFIPHSNGFNPLDLNLWTYIRPFDFGFLLDLIVIGVLALMRLKGRTIAEKRERKRQPVLAAILMAAAISVVAYDHYRIDVQDATKGQMIFFKMCWVPFQSMSNMSPIGYHLFDGLRLLGEAKVIDLAEQDRAEVKDWFAQNAENLPDNAYKGKFQGKNLFVIQVESLEAFVLGQKVSGQEITPNLNRMMGSSLNFTNFYEQVNDGTSSDSDLLTTTSVFPLRAGTNFYRYPTNTYHSLPKLLEGIGYQTISSHPEPAGNWNWIEAHHNIGYQKSWDLRQFTVDDQVGLGLSDESYLRQMGDKIKDEQQPFMLHLVTLSSHGPFDMAENKKELQLDPAFDQTIMGAYFQAVHYTDKQIGSFLTQLDKKGLLEQSVIVVYGDHTGVHKYYQDKINAIPSLENEAWRQPTLKLPFLVYSKGMQGESIDTVGGQIDTLPTLSYLMGVDAMKFENTAMGKILVNTKRNYTILNDGSIVGVQPSGMEQRHILRSFQIADWVHGSNYFEK